MALIIYGLNFVTWLKNTAKSRVTVEPAASTQTQQRITTEKAKEKGVRIAMQGGKHEQHQDSTVVQKKIEQGCIVTVSGSSQTWLNGLRGDVFRQSANDINQKWVIRIDKNQKMTDEQRSQAEACKWKTSTKADNLIMKLVYNTNLLFTNCVAL